jgi:hypothetical protein
MNRLFRSAVFVAVVALAPVVAALAAKGPYEIKSGMVETTSSAFGNVTTVEYFDDYGVKNAKYTTTTMMGQTTHKLEIHLPDGSSYDIDLDQKTGTLMRLTPEQAQMLAGAMAPALTKDARITSLPGKDFLGKKCDGKQVEAMGAKTRVWTWKGIALYTELGMGQSPIVTRATKVSEEAVPAAKFAVPAGIKIQRLTE